MDLDKFFGRAWNCGNLSLSTDVYSNKTIGVPNNTHAAAMAMFGFWCGEVNVHIANNTEGNLEAIHSQTTTNLSIATGTASSSGAVVIPPKQMATLCAPYYTMTAVKSTVTHRSDLFGVVFCRSFNSSGAPDFWCSLRAPNFTFPIPVPAKGTTRSQVEDAHAISSLDEAKRVAARFALDPDGDYEKEVIDRNPILQYLHSAINFFDLRQGHRAETLLQDGDVESNPGPAQLVFKDRGIYKHYGVRIGDSVFQMQSENFLEAIFRGEVEIGRVPDDGNWRVEAEYPMDYFVHQYMNSELGKKYKFSCTENCETWARTAFPTQNWTQTKALGFFGVMIVTASLAAIALRDTSASTIASFF